MFDRNAHIDFDALARDRAARDAVERMLPPSACEVAVANDRRARALAEALGELDAQQIVSALLRGDEA